MINKVDFVYCCKKLVFLKNKVLSLLIKYGNNNEKCMSFVGI